MKRIRPFKYAACLLILLYGLSGCRISPKNPPTQGEDSGRILFGNYCAACHQTDGSGTVDGPPPLVDSDWVKGPESRIIRVVLHGVRGLIQVGEGSYNLEMPGFGAVLSDEAIASLLSYVRAQFGKSSPGVESQDVKRIRTATVSRTDYWTADELLKIP